MTVWEHYRSVAEQHGDRPAVIDQQGAELTHRQLRARAASVGTGLVDLGLSPGDHLGVFLPNRTAWPILALAAAHSGIGILGLNTRFRHAELNHLLGVAQIDTVVVADRFLGLDGPGLLAELHRPIRPIVLAERSTAAPIVDGVAFTELEAGAARSATGASGHSLIGFTTSGTTGFPKIAMHDQAQTLSHLLAVGDTFGLGPSAVALAPLPLCGAFGYTAAMATILTGGAVICHETWDPEAAAADIAAHKVSFFNGSDDMVLALLASPSFEPTTSWTTGGFADFTNAGARAVAEADALTNGRTRLTGLYGSSEGFALMSAWDAGSSPEDRSRNGGYVVGPEMEVRCCDPDTGEPTPDGEPGELQFRGPNLITGYLNNPEETDKAFTGDGWYRSGDLGLLVEPDNRGHQGFVYLARIGDSLRLRGFLCDPAEIENHLERHPDVELAQVVGVRRPGTGDVAMAFVRLEEPTNLEAEHAEQELLEHCRNGLANYKRPERVIVVDDFPVTDGPNGVKIRKVELRDRAASLLD